VKIDDGLNGAIFIVLGSLLIFASLGMPRLAHIEYGPGLLPGLVGTGFCFAGAILMTDRLLRCKGKVVGLIQSNAANARGFVNVFLVASCILTYIFFAEAIGFLLLAPVLLFILIFWFEKQIFLAAICAVTGTVVFHLFFYQLMSAPLPWGLLVPWAGILTW
jgi:putative tricarboxylic transport membrane protein